MYSAFELIFFAFQLNKLKQRANIHLSGPSNYCEPPPTIENTESAFTSNSTLGDTVLYACQNGLIKVSGDSRLTCSLTQSYDSSWTGSLIDCGNKDNGGGKKTIV